MSINLTSVVLWILRITAALIMLQTLFFKFSGSEESIYIFSRLGVEPWGRIATGILELVSSLLLLYPKTTFLGALLGTTLMAGAIGFHLTGLGIVVRGDGGLLFIYAMIVFIACIILLVKYRNELILFLKTLFHNLNL